MSHAQPSPWSLAGHQQGWAQPVPPLLPASFAPHPIEVRLAEEVGRRVTDDGGEPGDLSCPSSAKVEQDVTAVCHGTDHGDPATFVVFSEDARGAYALLEV